MQSLDATGLLESIRTAGQIPAGGDWTDTKLLELATEQLRTVVAPLLIAHQESYFNDRSSVALVAGQSIYRIPSAAVGGKLVGLYYQVNGQQPLLLNQTAEDRLKGWSINGLPEAFYFYDSSNVCVVPTPQSATGSLVFKFNRRTADLVAVDSTRVISAVSLVSAGVYRFTVSATLTAGVAYDVVKGSPNFDTLQASAVVSIPGGSPTYQATFSKGAPEVGDGVFVVGQSHFVQVPPEYFYYLSQSCACKYLQDIGQLEELKAAVALLTQMQKGLTPAAAPRSDEAPKKLRNSKLFTGSRW